MTIPRLNGWWDEIAPSVPLIQGGLEKIFDPHRAQREAFQANLARNPEMITQIANMSPEERAAFIGSMQLKGSFANQLQNMPEGMELGDRKITQQAVQGALKDPNQRSDLLAKRAGVRTDDERRLGVARTTTAEVEAKNAPKLGEQTIAINDLQLKDLEEKARLKARREGIIAQTKGNIGALYQSYRSGKFDVDTTRALLSDEGIQKYFSERLDHDFKMMEMQQRSADRRLQQNEWREQRALMIAQQTYTATQAAGGLQAHLDIQNPQLASEAQKMLVIKQANPSAYVQAVAQNPRLAQAVEALEALGSMKDERKTKIATPLIAEIRKAGDEWKDILASKKAKKPGLEAAEANLTASTQGALQQLATLYGVKATFTVTADNGERGFLERNKAPSVVVQINDGVNTQTVSLADAENIAQGKGKLAPRATETPRGRPDPRTRFSELSKQNPTWDEAQVLAKMKQEGYKF